VGTAGRVRTYRTDQGWRARTLFRDYDGATRAIERHGNTQGAAERALAVAIRDRVRAGGSDSITGDTRIAALAKAWLTQIEEQHKSPTTAFAYRYAADRHVIPGLGNLRVRELTVGAIHRFLRTVSEHHGYSTAKMCRSVLSGMCGLAARHDALERNPVRDVGPVSSGVGRRQPRALTAAEARQLRALLTYDDKAIERDLPDFVAMMLATGLRIGECAALSWTDIDLESQTVAIKGTVIRIQGRGLIVKPTKTSAGMRTLALPSWCVEMLRARCDKAPHNTRAKVTPVFPAVMGGLRDPSNTQADLRDAFRAAGYPWLTSHSLRKTTATLLDESGLSARTIADQLGHAHPSVTQDRYLGRGIASTRAASVLESLG
jgi:integrase